VSLVAHPAATPSRRRQTSEASKRWKATDDPQPTDTVPVHLPRWLRDRVDEERARLDPPRDGLGRPRQQQSTSAFVERLVRKGLQWSAALPPWTDPLAIEGDDLGPGAGEA